MIFYVLRSLASDRLVRINSTESMLDVLEIIFNWLQVSVSDCNRQTLQIKILTCVQGLGSERPSDLSYRFQSELLRHKTLHGFEVSAIRQNDEGNDDSEDEEGNDDSQDEDSASDDSYVTTYESF